MVCRVFRWILCFFFSKANGVLHFICLLNIQQLFKLIWSQKTITLICIFNSRNFIEIQSLSLPSAMLYFLSFRVLHDSLPITSKLLQNWKSSQIVPPKKSLMLWLQNRNTFKVFTSEKNKKKDAVTSHTIFRNKLSGDAAKLLWKLLSQSY